MGKSGLHAVSRRSSMLGLPKLRHKEERKKILKMCVRKLQSIEDPENFLCRSVLINNTLKTLQNLGAKDSSPSTASPPPSPPPPPRLHLEDDDPMDVLISNGRYDDDRRESAAAAAEEEEEEEEEEERGEGVQDEAASLDESDTSELLDRVCVPDLKEEEEGGDEADIEVEDDVVKGGGGEEEEEEEAAASDEQGQKDLDSYCHDDILSDIIMPPPLSPCLEDLTNCTFQDGYFGKPTSKSSPGQPSSAYAGWLDDQLHWDSYHSEQTYRSWCGRGMDDDREEDQYKATIDINVLIEGEEEEEGGGGGGGEGGDASSEAVVPDNKENVGRLADAGVQAVSRPDLAAAAAERSSRVVDYVPESYTTCGQSSYLAGIQAVAYSSLLTSLES